MAVQIHIDNYAYLTTQRFLKAIDKIMGNRSEGKITQQRLGEALGINSSNINRLRIDPSRRVTLEACCRLCDLYKVSAHWLLVGGGEMFGNDELVTAHNLLEKRVGTLENDFSILEKRVEIIEGKGKKRG